MKPLSEEIISIFRREGREEARKGMSRYGIKTDRAFGVPLPFIRNLSKKYRHDHMLADELWHSGWHEARIMAGIIDNPAEVSQAQMELWVADFDSWDVCDQCCSNLFVFTPFAFDKALQWANREEEFVKRAGFVMMACLAVKNKKMKNQEFDEFFKLIAQKADDERNMVKKAVNWALRQMGKRNAALNEKAVRIAEKLLKSSNRATVWIAKDALRELNSDAVRKRLSKKI